MGALDGRVAIHHRRRGAAIGPPSTLCLFAMKGAKSRRQRTWAARMDGTGDDRTPAQQVVDEIKAAGGEAIANADNVADWGGRAEAWSTPPLRAFGDLHVLVNNAGHPCETACWSNMTEGRVGERRSSNVPPQGPLHPRPMGRYLLAGADQGGARRSRRRSSTPRRPPGLVGQRRPCQLRGGQGPGIGRLHRHPGPGTDSLRRAHTNAIAPPAARTRLTEGPRPVWARSSKPPDDPGRFGRLGTRPTSRPWSPIWPPRAAPANGKVLLRPGRPDQAVPELDHDPRAIEKNDRWTVAELESQNEVPGSARAPPFSRESEFRARYDGPKIPISCAGGFWCKLSLITSREEQPMTVVDNPYLVGKLRAGAGGDHRHRPARLRGRCPPS